MSRTVRSWVEDQLNRLPFVAWDEFLVVEQGDDTCFRVYGWIDDGPGRRDFVLLDLYPDLRAVEAVTSSDDRRNEIHEKLYEEAPDDTYIAVDQLLDTN